MSRSSVVGSNSPIAPNSGEAMAATTTSVKARNSETVLEGIMRCTRNSGSKQSSIYPILVAKCYNQGNGTARITE